MAASSTVLYFAFGSNLKKKRLNINCPCAEFVSIAKLSNYQLKFLGRSLTWGNCATATIVKSVDGYVWGSVWRLPANEVEALDKQEGVHLNIYKKLSVSVTTPDDTSLECITYARPEDDPPGLPSPQYLQVILEGGKEINLPESYMQNLSSIETNGYTGKVHLSQDYVL